MTKVSYPAVFHFENNEYRVEFPDLEGCFSKGKAIKEAYENSINALAMYFDKNDGFEKLSKPSSIFEIIKKYPNEIVKIVELDLVDSIKNKQRSKIFGCAKGQFVVPDSFDDLDIGDEYNNLV